MRRVILSTLAGAAALVGASSAQAAVVVCAGDCVVTDENVLITTATNQAVINGETNNTGANVIFTSATDLLNGDASGQANVSASDGLLNSLTFALTGGATFATALFNLNPIAGPALNEAVSVVISYFTPGLGTQTMSIDVNGSNFISIYGTAGEQFTSAGFAGDPITTGISDMRQLRLGGVNLNVVPDPNILVPEPGTWAMMLFGFGAAGFALRRRKRPLMRSVQIA